MRYQIFSPWPAAGHLIPHGTIVDFDHPSMFEPYLARTTVPPPNAVPLDQEAWTVMDNAYRVLGIIISPFTPPQPNKGVSSDET